MEKISFSLDLPSISNLAVLAPRPVPPNIIKILSRVLQDCIYCMEIFNGKTYKAIDLKNYIHQPTYERFQLPTTFSIDDQPEFATDMQKIYHVSNLFCNLLEKTKAELMASGQFTFLTYFVQNFDYTKEEDDFLLQIKEEKKYKKKIEEEAKLDKTIRKIVEEKFSLLDHMKSEREQMEIIYNLKSNYINKWEESSMEQCIRKGKLNRRNKRREIYNTKNTINEELQTHMSIANYLWLDLDDLQERIRLQQEQYHKDMEMQNITLSCIKDKREAIQFDLQLLKDQYQSRIIEIEKYLNWKERIKVQEAFEALEAEEERKKIVEAASIISIKRSRSVKPKSKSENARRTG